MKRDLRRALIAVALLVPGAPQAAAAQAKGVTVDAARKAVLVPCRIAPRKLPNLPEVYPIEVVATQPTPKGQKAHETIVVFDVTPSEVHRALESLGLKPGKPGRGEDPVSGPLLELTLELPAAANAPARQVPIEQAVVDKKTGRPLPRVKWHFTGSVLKEKAYAADGSGTLVSLYPVTDEVVIQSGLTMREEGMIKLDTNKAVLPAEGTPVTLVIRVATGEAPTAAPAAPANPDREVLRLSRNVGPAPLPPPTLSFEAQAPPAATPDPFEHRREIRPGRGLSDSARPLDLPAKNP